MKKNNHTISLLLSFCTMIILLLSVSTCNQSTEEAISSEDFSYRKSTEKLLPKVQLQVAQKATAQVEIFSNGLISASQIAKVQFEKSGRIKQIAVKNGERVRRGQLIASLDNEALLLEIEKKKTEIGLATLNMQDLLLSMGYDNQDSIPSEIAKVARLRAGVDSRKLELQELEKTLSQTQLEAPFSGVIANLEAQAFNLSSDYESLCTILSDDAFYIDFSILEEEMDFIKLNKKINFHKPSSPAQTFVASIKEINPIIENGLIKVRALSRKNRSALVHGAHVNVKIEKTFAKQIALPNSAIVDRDDKKVVFTYEDGVALWNYVQVKHKTRDFVYVESEIKEGDQVITAGNTYLIHKAEVRLGE